MAGFTGGVGAGTATLRMIANIAGGVVLLILPVKITAVKETGRCAQLNITQKSMRSQVNFIGEELENG
jgi:hypothetical protein